MKPFTKETGLVAPLDRVNVDTDQIIPKQFLKRIERTGFGQYLFFDWRFINENEPNPDFELNKPRYEGASILLTRNNFGSGSSREHAPWALLDYGFRVVLAPSFADIFFNNCFKNGILPIVLPAENIEELFQRVNKTPGYKLSIDLESQKITDDQGLDLDFDVDPYRKDCLLKGLDDIGVSLQYTDAIDAFEKARAARGY